MPVSSAKTSFGYMLSFGPTELGSLCVDGYMSGFSGGTGFCHWRSLPTGGDEAFRFDVDDQLVLGSSDIVVNVSTFSSANCAASSLVSSQELGRFGADGLREGFASLYDVINFTGDPAADIAVKPYAVTEYVNCTDFTSGPRANMRLSKVQDRTTNLRLYHPMAEVALLSVDWYPGELARPPMVDTDCARPADDSWARLNAVVSGTEGWYALNTHYACSTVRGNGVAWSLRVQCNMETPTDLPIDVRVFAGPGCLNESETQLHQTGQGCAFYTAEVGSTTSMWRARCLYSNVSTASAKSGDDNDGQEPDLIGNGPSNDGAPPGALVAVLPTTLMLSAVVYVLMTQKKKKKDPADESDGESEDDQDDLEARMPAGSKLSRVARLKRFGYSVSLIKVRTPGKAAPQNKTDAVAAASPEQDAEDDDDELDVVNLASADDVTLSRTRLGVGAHGKVYEGTFRGARVAVKEFLGKRSVESFDREVRNLKRLRHPNVVRLFAVFRGEERRLLVLELAPKSLVDVMTPDALPTPPSAVALLQWAQQTASGLAFMHARGLIHFDVKPNNLLLDAAWNIKICDFGVSRDTRSVARAPDTNDQEGGTPSYTAPEVLTGDRSGLTDKVDVYGFAIVLWQLFHRGRDPHPAEWSLVQVLSHVSVHKFRPELDKALPAPLADLLRAAWHHDPARRPSMTDVHADLHALLGPRSVDIANNGSFSNRPPLELGQRVFAYEPESRAWLPGIFTIAANRDRDDMTYRLDDPDCEPVHQDNLILASSGKAA